jgi:hypothetical protein
LVLKICLALPIAARKHPCGSTWLHEIKHDGYRLIARRDGDRSGYSPDAATIGARNTPAFLDVDVFGSAQSSKAGEQLGLVRRANRIAQYTSNELQCGVEQMSRSNRS